MNIFRSLLQTLAMYVPYVELFVFVIGSSAVYTLSDTAFAAVCISVLAVVCLQEMVGTLVQIALKLNVIEKLAPWTTAGV